MTMTGAGRDDGRAVDVQPDPALIGQAVAEQITAVVAVTLQFVLLHPQAWLYGRITADEADELRRVVGRLTGMRADQLATCACPVCGHESDCVEGCPVSTARVIARRQ
jgi:hypothetical protein